MSGKTIEENIQSSLQENRLFSPSTEFSQQAFIKSRDELDALHAKAEADHEGFWAGLARTELDWKIPSTTALNKARQGLTQAHWAPLTSSRLPSQHILLQTPG